MRKLILLWALGKADQQTKLLIIPSRLPPQSNTAPKPIALAVLRRRIEIMGMFPPSWWQKNLIEQAAYSGAANKKIFKKPY